MWMEATAAENLDPAAVIAGAPDDEFALIELRVDWPHDLEIYPQHRQLWQRFFVLTGDPLAWIADRGEAWAAVTVDAEVLEVDVYVNLPAVLRGMEEHDGDVAAAIAPYASTAMQAALDNEELLVAGDYHALAVAGEAPRLLERLDEEHSAFGTPAVQCRRGWAPIGFGALFDLVQEAFGYVDFDRSPVQLPPVDPSTEKCPACMGLTFGFPTDLEDARKGMCPSHDKLALAIRTERIGRAHESNRAGWRAIDKAAMRINKLPEPTFAPQPPRIVGEAPDRNAPCPCGSGKKYKRCHGA
jgi:hypothetical protein